MSNDIISIGWDVRGWQSKQQATAVLKVSIESNKYEWLGVSELFSFTQGEKPSLDELLRPAVGEGLSQQLLTNEMITLAIDAPLGFSQDYINLLQGKNPNINVPTSEIENTLAYRDCERWVAQNYDKKPLSGAFDKLGNNATLAMSIAENLKQDDFVLIPQKANNADRSVIEVYPGICKAGKQRVSLAISSIARILPSEVIPGTDQYDAAICAVIGALYSGASQVLDIPMLEPIPNNINLKEGWIFGLPPQYVKSNVS